MHTVIACLLIAMLMPIVCSWIGGYYRYKQPGGLDNKYPRLQVAKLEGPGHRAYAAQQNCWEALGMFSAALLAIHMSGVVIASLATLCTAFIVLRVVYIACYLANQDAMRSAAFIGGFGICIYFFYLALVF
jgi:uncharacterized MAPEG superfamily protein